MKGRLFLLLFALPFAGFGTWVLWLIGSELSDARAMRSWEPVSAQLERAGVETRRGDDSDTYVAYARYRYTYAFVSYAGDRVSISSSWSIWATVMVRGTLAILSASAVAVDQATPANSSWGSRGRRRAPTSQ